MLTVSITLSDFWRFGFEWNERNFPGSSPLKVLLLSLLSRADKLSTSNPDS